MIDYIKQRLPDLNQIDSESIDQLIRQLLEEKWTDNEIVKFCRLTEECNPDLDETMALRRMKSLREEVNVRLGS